MKYVLCITLRCNLRCGYCYVGKRDARMPLSIAAKIVDFAYRNTPGEERIDFGFFGGEPLLEFDLIKSITAIIEGHPEFDSSRVQLGLATNGTIFSERIAAFVNEHDITFGISCDGPPEAQDTFRRFPDGKATASTVEKTLKRALESIPTVLVNSVYHPRTLQDMPQTVAYFSALGLRQINFNADYSAGWSRDDIELLTVVYDQIGDRFIAFYVERDPHFINLIDGKIAAILRGGYTTIERCRMGAGEFSFSPEGNIYPCERLVGDGTENRHCIGHIDNGLDLGKMSCHRAPDGAVNAECGSCSLAVYCMNWCGCSNYMATGYYNRVNDFLCASEKAAIRTAFRVFQTLEQALGPTFVDHLSGFPWSNSVFRR